MIIISTFLVVSCENSATKPELRVIRDTIFMSVDTSAIIMQRFDEIKTMTDKYWEFRENVAKKRIESALNGMYAERDRIVYELDSLKNTIFKDNMIINGSGPAEARFDSTGKPILIMK